MNRSPQKLDKDKKEYVVTYTTRKIVMADTAEEAARLIHSEKNMGDIKSIVTRRRENANIEI